MEGRLIGGADHLGRFRSGASAKKTSWTFGVKYGILTYVVEQPIFVAAFLIYASHTHSTWCASLTCGISSLLSSR